MQGDSGVIHLAGISRALLGLIHDCMETSGEGQRSNVCSGDNESRRTDLCFHWEFKTRHRWGCPRLVSDVPRMRLKLPVFL